MSLSQSNHQDGDGLLARSRKTLNTPLGKTDSRLIAVFELLAGAGLLVATLVRPIDWGHFWPSGKLETGSAFPWGAWWTFVIVTNFLIYHAVCVFRRKRWAVILTAFFASLAFVYSLIAITNQALAAYHSLPSKTPLRDYSWWITWLSWTAIYYSVCKEGIQALRRQGVYNVAPQTLKSAEILEPDVVHAGVGTGG
jgi:hypothetical protein